eukprot:5706302-Amphidinium_carterae.1
MASMVTQSPEEDAEPPQIEAFNVERVANALHVYEVWSRFGGRARFRCAGRCVTGPAKVDLKYNVFAWIAINVPVVLEAILCGSWLWELSPLLPIATILLYIVTLLMLLLTSCTDPGWRHRNCIKKLVL